MNIAYVRVSTEEQNEQRQIEALEKFNIEKWFKEKVSGKNTDRAELKNMIEFARDGDTIYVLDFSRLARSTIDLLSLVDQLNKKNIHLVSIKENVDSSTPTGKLMLTMIGAIAEFERANILERQREGIEIAKREGKYVGRQPAKVNKELFETSYEQYITRKLNKIQFAAKINVTRPTLDKLIKAYENKTIAERNGNYYVDPLKSVTVHTLIWVRNQRIRFLKNISYSFFKVLIDI